MDYRDTAALSDLELMLLDETAEPKALPLSLLEDITNSFSSDQEIGRGGFAVVYKGVLGNGTLVAVKRLFNMYMHEKKFHTEVECLMKARHRNIVRFLGYCANTQGNMMAYNGRLVMADKQERLLCFEYMPGGSLRDYIGGKSCGLEWRKCCQIIKGICHGLNYLHEKHIVHLDLKPENVLLDDNMVPKITDFGLSKCFEENQTSQSITSNLCGTLGYIAPELHNRDKITIKSDIFSLGIIIIEILTGQKGYPDDVEAVLKSWCDRLEKPSEDKQLEEIRVCIEIGIECSEFNPAKRPGSTQNIIERLMKIEDTDEVFSAVSSTVFTKLVVHPGLLYFYCVPDKLISSSMYVRNFTGDHFAFRLAENYAKETERCFAKLPLYGIVPPRSIHTFGLTLQEREEKSIHLVLESSTIKNAQMPTSHGEFKGDKFFEEIKEKGNMVQQVKVKAVATAQREMEKTSELIPPETKIVFKNSPFTTLDCEDVNPPEQWIITGHIRGYVHTWNGHTQESDTYL
uniref:Uncharacterized protein n=1 Tax=Avena sativa TaxID=4498 RepID=A0ACD5TBM1_AVESA